MSAARAPDASIRQLVGVVVILLTGVMAVLLSGCAERSPMASHSGRVPVEVWTIEDWSHVPVRLTSPDARPGTFLDARAIVADARGRIHVSDAGRHAILYADPHADRPLEWSILGGPGADQGQFMAPEGLDVDAGSILGVADTGNGRIQRFTRGGAIMEIIQMEPRMPADVRYVQALADGTLFILTDTEPFLFRMDRIREQVSPVYLVEQAMPVDMARFGNGLAVLDASGTLHVLSSAGVTVRRLTGIPFIFIDPIQSGLIARTGPVLWVFNARLEPVEAWQLPDSMDSRGAAVSGADLLVISRTHLHRLP
ncbi:MAG: hypothetical protein RIE53_03710 [Rhodothermales bacterium]